MKTPASPSPRPVCVAALLAAFTFALAAAAPAEPPARTPASPPATPAPASSPPRVPTRAAGAPILVRGSGGGWTGYEFLPPPDAAPGGLRVRHATAFSRLADSLAAARDRRLGSIAEQLAATPAGPAREALQRQAEVAKIDWEIGLYDAQLERARTLGHTGTVRSLERAKAALEGQRALRAAADARAAAAAAARSGR